MWILVILLVVIAAIVFVTTAYFHAKLQVYKLPRKEMFWCHKHGPFLKEHCLTLDSAIGFSPVNALTQKPGNIECCPICFKEKWDGAKQEAYL